MNKSFNLPNKIPVFPFICLTISGGHTQIVKVSNHFELEILGETIEELGGKLVGFTSTDGYDFESSRAIRNNQFMGLMLDQDTQAKLTKKRIDDWVKQLEKEMQVQQIVLQSRGNRSKQVLSKWPNLIFY